MEDQYRFILYHEVMESKTDEPTALDVVKETPKYCATVRSFSIDKGGHCARNLEEVAAILARVVMPKKGYAPSGG